MKRHGTGCAAVASGLLLLATSGCRQGSEGWMPILEETTTTFLTRETESAARRLEAARGALYSDPEKADAELEAARDSLDHLITYYLPLLEARELAYNAYRHYQLGRIEQSNRELDRVESILMTVAQSGHGNLVSEMEEPLEKLEDARVAMQADPEEAADALGKLATRLNSLLVKGGLVLSR